MTNRWVTLGFSIGDSTPPFSPCIGDQIQVGNTATFRTAIRP
jgi:hypothetical protein